MSIDYANGKATLFVDVEGTTGDKYDVDGEDLALNTKGKFSLRVNVNGKTIATNTVTVDIKEVEIVEE